MNPFLKPIKFSERKPNHFYCIKENETYLKVDDPKKNDIVYEVPIVSGGAETKKLLLEIPIPLCQKHQHEGIPFGVKTCGNWEYIAIPTPLGSLTCRECNGKLFTPQPYLCSVDLSDSNLRGSNLRGSDLSDSNLSGSDFSGSDLSDSNFSGSNFSDSNLSCSNLRGSDLRGSNLRGSNLRGSDFSDSNLSGSNLRGSDLSGSNLSNANLRSAINIKYSINLNRVYWNEFTLIDEQFKKLLNKERFLK